MTTDIPADALCAVLDRFGLDGARVERSFEASTRNDNLLAVSASGEQFVLRRCRHNRDMPRVEFQLRFQQYLYSAGYSAPDVLSAAVAVQIAAHYALIPR